MKRDLMISLILICAGMLTAGLGCNVNPKPEVPATAYGKVVSELPDIPEAKARYKYPDYVELRHIPK